MAQQILYLIKRPLRFAPHIPELLSDLLEVVTGDICASNVQCYLATTSDSCQIMIGPAVGQGTGTNLVLQAGLELVTLVAALRKMDMESFESHELQLGRYRLRNLYLRDACVRLMSFWTGASKPHLDCLLSESGDMWPVGAVSGVGCLYWHNIEKNGGKEGSRRCLAFSGKTEKTLLRNNLMPALAGSFVAYEVRKGCGVRGPVEAHLSRVETCLEPVELWAWSRRDEPHLATGPSSHRQVTLGTKPKPPSSMEMRSPLLRGLSSSTFAHLLLELLTLGDLKQRSALLMIELIRDAPEEFALTAEAMVSHYVTEVKYVAPEIADRERLTEVGIKCIMKVVSGLFGRAQTDAQIERMEMLISWLKTLQKGWVLGRTVPHCAFKLDVLRLPLVRPLGEHLARDRAQLALGVAALGIVRSQHRKHYRCVFNCLDQPDRTIEEGLALLDQLGELQDFGSLLDAEVLLWRNRYYEVDPEARRRDCGEESD